MYSSPTVQPRDGSGGSTLSTSTIIIIAVVCGCLVVMVFVLFLWRLLVRSCRRKNPVPLPPVQPLAHHREQQASTHARTYSQHYLHPAASNVSLIPGSLALSSSSPLGTSVAEDGTSTESGSVGFASPLSVDSLPYPKPSFGTGHTPGNSTTSFATSTDSREGVVRSPSALFSETESSVSHATSLSGRPLASRPNASHARVPRSLSRPRSRPISRASSVATSHTTQSRGSVIHGAPHNPYNNIQIVLPAPLAPQTYPYMHADRLSGSRSSYALGGDDAPRRSVIDQWIPVGTRSLSMGPVGRSASPGPTIENRPQTSARTPSSLSQSVTAAPRRGQSQPRSSTAASLRSASPPSFSAFGSTSAPGSAYAPNARQPPPPVPQIPAAYGHLADLAFEPEEHSRGRQSVAPYPGAAAARPPPSAQYERAQSSERGRSRAAAPIAGGSAGPWPQMEKQLPLPRSGSSDTVTEPMRAPRPVVPEHGHDWREPETWRGQQPPPALPEQTSHASAPPRLRSNTLRQERAGPPS